MPEKVPILEFKLEHFSTKIIIDSWQLTASVLIHRFYVLVALVGSRRFKEVKDHSKGTVKLCEGSYDSCTYTLVVVVRATGRGLRWQSVCSSRTEHMSSLAPQGRQPEQAQDSTGHRNYWQVTFIDQPPHSHTPGGNSAPRKQYLWIFNI